MDLSLTASSSLKAFHSRSLHTERIGKNQISSNAPRNKKTSHFKEVLKEESQKLELSGHAERRVRSREIVFTAENKARVGELNSLLREKGVRSGVIMLKDTAYVVNPQKSLLVTVIPSKAEPMVFTNIDGVIFASPNKNLSSYGGLL